ncbi:hypothetical protein HIM_04861 [Hirsutella minnesotensis 3608]|uniref:UBX domain-containing protein n=1 Tax=Hirsutella minnesotensis 3608 TaxID=1043627 RepID=A0A0F8A5P8_9HYPO|nr:hypothetical protein HIM_04861 [Hirsutella minnesotensis 3608]
MFYQGSLEDGVREAASGNHYVLFFVTDGGEESQRWENDYLQEESVKSVVEGKAIAFRLEAGSEPANHLGNIFPIPQTPAILLTNSGELKEYFTAGTSKDDFVRRVRALFEPSTSARVAEASSAAAPVTPADSTPTGANASETLRAVMAERAARLAAEKEEKERSEKEARAGAQEKAKAEAEAGLDTRAAQTHRQAELMRKKRMAQADERNRILKRIEDDKRERRERAAERQKQRAEGLAKSDDTQTSVRTPETPLPSTARVGEMVSLQVRLFDGSTIRSRFKTGASFREVRSWVDGSRTDGKSPYTFKQLLTPLPNKAIDETEEGKPLEELGLAPSSTLILVPVQSFASAYEEGSQGFVTRFLAVLVAWMTWFLGLIGIGHGREQPPSSHRAESPSAATQARDRRIKGFDNPLDRQRDHQLYNGNSLNFEPRSDEADAGEK